MHYSEFLHGQQRDRARDMAKRGMSADQIASELQRQSSSAFNGRPDLPPLPESPVLVTKEEIAAIAGAVQTQKRQVGAVKARGTPPGFFRGEPVKLSLSADDLGDDDDPRPVWIQLAKPGTFKGHPSGKPFALTRTVFEQAVRNFKGNKDGRLPVDFEHASEQQPGEVAVEGAPAQGWIVDMKIGDDGNLFALVEWGPLARKYIREGSYRYISPAIHLQMKDRETGQPIGAYISSAGLTNSPFLDGMQPLAASMHSHSALTARLMRDEGLRYRDAEAKATRLIREELGR